MFYEECTKTELQTCGGIFPDGTQRVPGNIPVFTVYVQFQLIIPWQLNCDTHVGCC